MSPLFAGRASAAALAALAALSVVGTGTASAQCVDIEEGDVLVADLTANKIIRLNLAAEPNANQEVVCIGEDETAQPRVLFPRSLDNDREGRLWISMNYNVVRADPATDSQVTVMVDQLNAPPRGIAKQRDGDVFLAWPDINNFGHILRINRLYGLVSDHASENSGIAFPLGLIFDPSPGAAPGEMLLASSPNVVTEERAGAYLVLSNGGAIPIALYGFIASPERIASTGDQFIYLSDQGGLADPDGLAGPELPATRPPQVIQVDRTITVDFNDPAADFKANQKLISEGGLLDVPIGIVLLDGDGEGLDSVLVASGGTVLGDGLVLRIDFDPQAADPSATSTQTLISQGQNFLNPWGLHIVEGIDPLPKEPLYVTDVSTADGPGVFFVDPTAAAPPPPSPPPLATGTPFVRPNGIVADPDNAELLLVADGGLPGVIEVNATNGATSIVSQDDLLQGPTNVIADASGDLLVTDNGASAIIRIDRDTGTQSIVSPSPSEKNFLQSPVSTGIGPDGFLVVSDQGTGNADSRLITVSPTTGKQWCTAEGVVVSPLNVLFSIDRVQDLNFDENGSFVFAIDAEAGGTILRFDELTEPVIFGESASLEYVTPRGLAFAENRDMLTVDAGTSSGDGRVLRLDPLSVEPTVVPNSTGLGDPFGVALAGKPRPRPALIDTDGDGVLDPEDNCVETPNPGQLDTDNNCLGDLCDAGPDGPIACDNSGDDRVGGPDFTLMIEQFGSDCTPEGPDTDCTADCTGDDRVGGPDFSRLVAEIGNELTDFFGILVSLDPVGPCTDPGPGPGLCTIPSP